METTTETVAMVLSKQVIVPQWLREAVKGLEPSEVVTVTRKVTPFGTYLMGVTR